MILEIKDRLTIRECFNHFGVSLPARRNPVIRCCFHDEKTGSLKLYEDQGRFYCYGCGAYGDVIDAAARLLGTEPSAARSYLIAMLGLEDKALSSSRPRLSEAQQFRRLRAHVERISLQAERFDIPKVPAMEAYLVHVFSLKEDLDRRFKDAATKLELLAYLGELTDWREWAQSIMEGAWRYWTDRAMEYLSASLSNTSLTNE